MAEFINTIDVLGDDAVIDSIIDRSITEFKDDTLTTIGDYAFYQCASLSVLDLPNVENMKQYAFQGCVSLARVSLPKFSTDENVNGLFDGCAALTDVYVPTLQYVGWSMFRSCANLKKIDLPRARYINSLAFRSTELKVLILRRETLCGLNHPTAVSIPAGYIYVPRALVEEYKAATNWSTFATQFRALEDYTVDGTITGELDETKI